MSNPLAGIDTDRWYLVWIICCMLGLTGAMLAKEPRYVGVAFGLLLFGMGELINHPLRHAYWHDGYDIRATKTMRSRKNSILGLLVAGVGLVIAVWNGYRLLLV